MNDVPLKMKITTPFGEEDLTVEKKDNHKLTLSILKGYVDLDIVIDDEDLLLAEGNLSVPFDCRLIFSMDKDSCVVKIEDPILDEVYLESICEVV